MKPYPNNNNIDYKPITPVYTSNNTPYKSSRYSTYNIIDNSKNKELEIKLSNTISENRTFKGYYYTVEGLNENLYSIAKKYYGNEDLYWIIAKANNLKDDGLAIMSKGITLIIPNYNELQNNKGYFNMKTI